MRIQVTQNDADPDPQQLDSTVYRLLIYCNMLFFWVFCTVLTQISNNIDEIVGLLPVLNEGRHLPLDLCYGRRVRLPVHRVAPLLPTGRIYG